MEKLNRAQKFRNGPRWTLWPPGPWAARPLDCRAPGPRTPWIRTCNQIKIK